MLCGLVLAACATSQMTPGDAARSDATTAADARPDAAAGADASGQADAAPGTDASAAVDALAGAYRHTIAIDGTNDFAAADTFTTTSAPGYAAYVSWDDDNLYVGYRGPDLDPAAQDTATKWLFVYVDTDPGAGTGAIDTLTYNTQRATFPAGFGAEHYVRWKCNGSFGSLESYQGNAWVTSTTSVTIAHTGDFLELAIPRTVFGGAPAVGVVTWMINEKAGFEGSYAGLYQGNFTDGYAATLALTRYLSADFASTAAPNDATNAAP